MKLYDVLYQMSVQMRQTRGGKIVYDIFESTGVRMAVSRFFNRITAKKEFRHPTERMIQSKSYFERNRERVQSVLEMLADEESRNVLKKMVAFRGESDYSKLPYNSMRKQYFVNDFFAYSDDEVFVDCGAYDGDSINSFKKRMKKLHIRNYTIIAFEPDKENCRNLKRNHPDVKIIEAGCWDKKDLLSFSGGAESQSAITESERSVSEIGDSDSKIQVTAIDEEIICKNATFIKMDIEGAEQKALIGARETILRNKPKLAISIYHSDEDMLRLIEWIHDLVPEYKLYVRQHSNCICETVCYATV